MKFRSRWKELLLEQNRNPIPIYASVLGVGLVLGLGLGSFFFKGSGSTGSIESSCTPYSSDGFVGLAEAVVPSVASISTISLAEDEKEDGFEEFFKKFFGPYGGDGQGEGPREAVALGTGFIVDEGLLLTNSHVVSRAQEIKIKFTENPNEKPRDAKLIGNDSELDLALIEFDPGDLDLKPLVLGDSDELKVGELVIAIGNPVGHGHSVSHGIISALDRDFPNSALGRYLQTDAPINPGNSGGPLVNLRGEVVGINNAIDARAQGIGFAIPSNLAKKVLPQLKKKGFVARGYIGVLVEKLTPEIAEQIDVDKDLKSPFVSHVFPGKAADEAGMKTYDVVVDIAGKAINGPRELVQRVTELPVGEKAKVTVLRGGKKVTLDVEIAERPDFKKRKTLGKGRDDDNDDEEDEEGSDEDEAWRKETGLSLEKVNPSFLEEFNLEEADVEGLRVAEVDFGGAADRAGIQVNDVILEIGQETITEPKEAMGLIKPGESVILRLLRPTRDEPIYRVLVFDTKKLND